MVPYLENQIICALAKVGSADSRDVLCLLLYIAKLPHPLANISFIWYKRGAPAGMMCIACFSLDQIICALAKVGSADSRDVLCLLLYIAKLPHPLANISFIWYKRGAPAGMICFACFS